MKVMINDATIDKLQELWTGEDNYYALRLIFGKMFILFAVLLLGKIIEGSRLEIPIRRSGFGEEEAYEERHTWEKTQIKKKFD